MRVRFISPLVLEDFVAIKKFKECKEDEIIMKTSLREVKILRMLRHENIVELKEAFRRKGKLYLVFEFVDKNLLEVITELHPSGFRSGLVRSTVWQIVRAIEYCHRHDVIHRDIKPENLLVNLSDMGIKLCDFGFARSLPVTHKPDLTDYVATRWYRAPELLVGSLQYGPEVDMFAIGCIMAEITDGSPLLPGESELDQLSLMQRVLGPLNSDHLEAFHSNPRFQGTHIPSRLNKGTRILSIQQRFGGKISKSGMALLMWFLEQDPALRISADAAIRDPYFDGVWSSINARRIGRASTVYSCVPRTTSKIGLPPTIESRQSSTESLMSLPRANSKGESDLRATRAPVAHRINNLFPLNIHPSHAR